MNNIASVKHFLCILDSLGIHYFVSGGFGLDGIRGRLTRKHKDIDVYSFEEELGALFERLKNEGYFCFRKLNKFEVRGNGIKADFLPLKKANSKRVLIGNCADTFFPKEIFLKAKKGCIGKFYFRVAPNEVFALEMPFSKYPEDRKLGTSLKFNNVLFKKIKNLQKEKGNIILEKI